jgi:hypothetical protein
LRQASQQVVQVACRTLVLLLLLMVGRAQLLLLLLPHQLAQPHGRWSCLASQLLSLSS